MKTTSIILVTHSNYCDICETFLSLFEKNWFDCPYPLYICITGNFIKFKGYNCIYCGKDTTLPGCIAIAKNKIQSDYYICLLGDAFIYKRINTDHVKKIINNINYYKIDYCCLVPHKARINCLKKINNDMRYISNKDVYCHSFVAFISNKKFIDIEFSNNITDLFFEKKYMADLCNKKMYYLSHALLLSNLFNIVPGIEKVKWNRLAYKSIKRNNLDIKLANREINGFFLTLRNETIKILQSIFPVKFRYIIKKILKNVFGIKFEIEY